MALVFNADALSSGQSVKGSGLSRPGSAAETLATVGCVNPTGGPFLQSAGHAAAAARLPEHLPAVCRDRRTVVELLLRAGGAADGLQPHHRG